MKKFCLFAVLAISLGSIWAADPEIDDTGSTLTIEIPRLNVSEYHRPYVASWIQNDQQQAVANLAVWYQQTKVGIASGTTWLPDLRQWWRRTGRNLQLPVDGVSGATRAAGEHTVRVRRELLQTLPPGNYQLIVEAVREVGDRELLEMEFTLPVKEGQILTTKGQSELGELKFVLVP